MIRFIQANPSHQKRPTFGDVKFNQFFVDEDGYLCQKHASDTYIVIADKNGEPYSYLYETVNEDQEIIRILPIIKKIEF